MNENAHYRKVGKAIREIKLNGGEKRKINEEGTNVIIFLYAFEGSDMIRYDQDFGEATWFASSEIQIGWHAARDDVEESSSSSSEGSGDEGGEVDANSEALDEVELEIEISNS